MTMAWFRQMSNRKYYVFVENCIVGRGVIRRRYRGVSRASLNRLQQVGVDLLRMPPQFKENY